MQVDQDAKSRNESIGMQKDDIIKNYDVKRNCKQCYGRGYVLFKPSIVNEQGIGIKGGGFTNNSAYFLCYCAKRKEKKNEATTNSKDKTNQEGQESNTNKEKE